MADEEVNKLTASLKQMQDKFTNDWKGQFEKQLDEKAIRHRENIESGKGKTVVSKQNESAQKYHKKLHSFPSG